jgi:hypothetical protein
MDKILFTTWFILKSYTLDGDIYNLLLEEPYYNYHVAVTIEEPLPEIYKENTWIKVKSLADCEKKEIPYTITLGQGFYTWLRTEYFCTAITFEVLECTEENSWILYGTRYC